MADDATVPAAAAPISVHLTSFGPFLNVTENPSEAVMHELRRMLDEACRPATADDAMARGGTPALVVASSEVLEVTPGGVKQYVTKRLEARGVEADGTAKNVQIDTPAAVPRRREINVHLGVYRAGVANLSLELRGVNDLHCPAGDFAGNVCFHQRIEDSDNDADGAGDTPAVAATPARDAAAAAAAGANDDGDKCIAAQLAPTGHDRSWLAPANGGHGYGEAPTDDDEDVFAAACSAIASSATPPIFPSTDAGRYLCNFMTYASLRWLASPDRVRRGRPVHGSDGGCRWGDRGVAGSATDACGGVERDAVSLFIHILPPDEAAGGFTATMQAHTIRLFLEALSARLWCC